jgi:hypothetical protein
MAHKHGGGGRGSGGGGGGGCLHAWEEVNFIHKQSGKAAGGGAGVYSQAPNLDWHAEFRNAGFRFSQLMYQGQTLVVHKLTESKFGIRKSGIRIEIGVSCMRMYAVLLLRCLQKRPNSAFEILRQLRLSAHDCSKQHRRHGGSGHCFAAAAAAAEAKF